MKIWGNVEVVDVQKEDRLNYWALWLLSLCARGEGTQAARMGYTRHRRSWSKAGGGQETKYVSCPRSRTPPYVRSPLVIKVLSEILTGKGEQGMGGGLENADAAQFSAFCTL